MELIQVFPNTPDFCLFSMVLTSVYPPESPKISAKETIKPNPVSIGFHGAYVVLKEGKAVARACLYLNPYLQFEGQHVACIGNYECIDSPEVSAFLLAGITEKTTELGYHFLIGPMNGSSWDTYRFNRSDKPLFLLEQEHPLYYNDHFSAAGFEVISDYFSSIDREVHCGQEEVLKLDKHFQKLGVQIREIDMNQYETELEQLFPFITEAFKSNFLYSPISWESFRDKYLEAAPIIRPEYVLLAEDRSGELIAFIFCYDNLLERNEKQLVVKTIARKNEKQWSGLGHVLANRVISLAKDRNYAAIIHAYMKESGTSTGISNAFMGEKYKRYSLYGRPC